MTEQTTIRGIPTGQFIRRRNAQPWAIQASWARMVLTWDELTEESVAAIELSPMALHGLDDPQLAIAVETRDDTLPAKQIEVRLDWRDQSGSRIQRVPLVAWKHHAPSAE